MKYKRNGLCFIILLTIMVVGGMYFPHQTAFAASPVQVAAVQYYDENIVVFNNGNTKIYYATDTDAAKEDWSIIPADAGKFTTIDTSWVSDSTENVLMIKGDIDKTKARVVLKQRPTKLNISINYSKIESLTAATPIGSLLNIMSTEGNGVDPIKFEDLEWKKGDNGNWKNTSSLTRALVEKFMVKGTYVNFRIRAVDDAVSVNVPGSTVDLNNNRVMGIGGGITAYENVAGVSFGTNYPEGVNGRRFSDPFKLKIAKKTPSASYTVDAEKFALKIRYGKEYKVTANYSDGTQGVSDWIKVLDKSVLDIKLEDILKNVVPQKKDPSGNVILYDGLTKVIPAMNIQIRDFATQNTSPSEVSEVSIAEQRKLTKNIQIGQPDPVVTQTDEDIYFYYFGNRYLLLTVPNATTDNPYEYCIVKEGYTLDPKHVTWYSITRSTGVKLLASKAPQNSTIYVRQKSIKSDPVTLASVYITQKVNYPSNPIITPQTIQFIKSYSASPDIIVKLNETGKVPFETTISSIKLGTKEIGCTAKIEPLASDPNISIMRITLNKDDLSALPNCVNKPLTVTFGNGIIDKTSIKLTVTSSTTSGSLTLSGDQGSASGKAKVSVVNSLSTGNSWVYATSATKVSGLSVQDTLASDKGLAFTSGMDIATKAGEYVVVYEIDATRHIMKYGILEINSAMIKP